MRLTVLVVFALATTLALLSSSLISWQLYSFVNENRKATRQQLENTFVSKAGTITRRMGDYIRHQLKRVELATHQTGRVLASFEGHPALETSASALSLLNTTLYNLWGPRVTFPDELYGFIANIMYPANTTNVTSLQSIQTAADVLFGGRIQPLHYWTDPSTGLVEAHEIVLTPGGADAKLRVAPTIQYTFDWLPSAAVGINVSSRYDLLAWQASDGNPWWCFIHSASLLLEGGFWAVPQSMATTAAWRQQFLGYLEDPVRDGFVLIDGDRRVILTSAADDYDRVAQCIQDAAGGSTIACIDYGLHNHPLPFYQTVKEVLDASALLKPTPGAPTESFRMLEHGGASLTVVLGEPVVSPNMVLQLVWYSFEDPQAEVMSTHVAVIVLIAFIFLASLLSTLGVACLFRFTFLSPMERMTTQMEAVTELDVEAIRAITASAAVEQRGFAEISDVRRAFGKMTQSIDLFLKYLPTDVVRDLMDAGERSGVVAFQEKYLTVVFADIKEFTQRCAMFRDRPTVLVTLLRSYFEAVSTALSEELCTIDKYIGDAVMGFWGAPLDCEHQETRSLRGALRLQSEVHRLKAFFAQHQWDLGVRVGLHSGPAMVGSIGSNHRLNYTALGNTVNIASRAEGLAKDLRWDVIATEDTLRGVRGDDFVTACVGEYLMKGADEPLKMYAVLGVAAPTQYGARSVHEMSRTMSTCASEFVVGSMVSMARTGRSTTSSRRKYTDVGAPMALADCFAHSEEAKSAAYAVNEAQTRYLGGDIRGALALLTAHHALAPTAKDGALDATEAGRFLQQLCQELVEAWTKQLAHEGDGYTPRVIVMDHK